MDSETSYINAIEHSLSDASKYSYLDELEHFSDIHAHSKTKSNDMARYLNTLELFAFGDYCHYIAYHSNFIVLDELKCKKLLKLTILSSLVSYDGTEISKSVLLNMRGVSHGIEDIKTLLKSPKSYPMLDRVLIEMHDEKLIDFEIDDAHNKLFVRRVSFIRDSYDPRYSMLRVLNTKDIPDRNVSRSLMMIKDWKNKRLEPTIRNLQDISTGERYDSEGPKSRKRKTTDFSH